MSTMEIFQPSIYISIFPYLFIASFPIFGIALVSKWLFNDIRRKGRIARLSNNTKSIVIHQWQDGKTPNVIAADNGLSAVDVVIIVKEWRKSKMGFL